MQKPDMVCLVLGTLITAIAACGTNPIADEALARVTESPAALATIGDQIPVSSIEQTPSTPSLAEDAPASPTGMASWPTIGSERGGLEVALPPDWVNLSDQITTPTIGNQLGINLLFAADSLRTGRDLLAGKNLDDGAYMAGLAVFPPAANLDPAAVLSGLIMAAAPNAIHLTEIEPITSANGIPGFALDMIGGPIGLAIAQPSNLYTRVALYAPEPANDQAPIWIALLLSASPARWSGLTDSFAQMMASAAVFNVGSGAVVQEGRFALRGSLDGDADQVTVTLERGVRDIWRFSSAAGRYWSLVLRPETPHMDLGLTLFGPDGQPVTQIDNGFTGATESVTDLALNQAGDYLVEINDLNGAAGRYTLAVVIADEPQYQLGGDIAFGEVLQGELPGEGQHDWSFFGVNRQRISVVVTPSLRAIDPILELYAPDGQLLLGLDEGYSGDPELINGFELPATGEYTLRVRNFSAEGGPYTVSLDEGALETTNFYDAGDLVYGDLRQESLQPQEVHTWFFEGETGDHVLVRVTPLGLNVDLTVWLLDTDLRRIAAVDRFASGEPETIELTLTQDGRNIILVQNLNGGAGDYEIALGAALATEPENAGSVSYGDVVLDTIERQSRVAWTFNAVAGDLLQVEVRPVDATGDLVLALQNPEGQVVVELDDGSAGQAEVIDAFAIPTTGEWQLILREFLGERVSYRLAIQRSE